MRAIALCVFILFSLMACEWGRAPRSTAALPHDAYVWQHVQRTAVRDAVASRASAFQTIVVLAAEISWNRVAGETTPRPVITRVAVDWKTFAGVPRLGLALRINPYSGPFSANDATIDTLTKVARELLDEAAKHHVTVAELQIDFDAATSKLAGYRTWVQSLRTAIAPTPIVITALPTWVGSSGFSELAKAAHAFVLQVHSLERPRNDDRFTLCDPDAARGYIEQAARLGIPFRVALPTYSYLYAFDASGKFAGISAEGPQPQWDDHFTVREVRADPVGLAQLVSSLQKDHPATLTGIIWYRLPIATDSRNWAWPTLSAVMAGRAPHAQLEFSVRSDAGLNQVMLRNTGDDEFRGPVILSVDLAGQRLVAADAQSGFALTEDTSHHLHLSIGQLRLAPDAEKSAGWLRLADPTLRPHVSLVP